MTIPKHNKHDTDPDAENDWAAAGTIRENMTIDKTASS